MPWISNDDLRQYRQILLVIVALIVFGFLAGMARAQSSSSPVRSCQEDYGFPYGCKIDRTNDGAFDCDGETVWIDWHTQGELLDFTATVPISLVANKASTLYTEHFFDPPTNSAQDLDAPEGRKISHSLFCWDDPGPELGACCIDCNEGSGVNDECLEESTEAFCDEAGGRWYLETPCSQVDDCEDECPLPELGSCCVECEPGSGGVDECTDEVRLGVCEDLGGSWLLNTPCAQRDDCGESCPVEEPKGAVCVPPGWPPSDNPNPEEEICRDDLTLEECSELFGEDWCADFWTENRSCEQIVCQQVPTAPWPAYVILAAVLAACALFSAHLVKSHGRRGLFR